MASESERHAGLGNVFLVAYGSTPAPAEFRSPALRSRLGWKAAKHPLKAVRRYFGAKRT